MHIYPSTRRSMALAVATVLSASSLAVAAPASADRGPTLVAACSGAAPKSSGFVFINHRFALPGKRNWKQRSRKRACRYKTNGATVRVVWRTNAGSMRSIRKRIKKARANHRGFRLISVHRRGPRFDHHTKRTAMARFSYKHKGKRVQVRLAGDKYTLMAFRAPKRHWKRWAKKSAVRAHRTMTRQIAIA